MSTRAQKKTRESKVPRIQLKKEESRGKSGKRPGTKDMRAQTRSLSTYRTERTRRGMDGKTHLRMHCVRPAGGYTAGGAKKRERKRRGECLMLRWVQKNLRPRGTCNHPGGERRGDGMERKGRLTVVVRRDNNNIWERRRKKINRKKGWGKETPPILKVRKREGLIPSNGLGRRGKGKITGGKGGNVVRKKTFSLG